MDGIHGGPTVIDCRSTAGPTREKRTVTTRTFRFDVSVCLCCREASFRVFLSFFLPACIQSCKQTTAATMMAMGMSFFHEPSLCVCCCCCCVCVSMEKQFVHPSLHQYNEWILWDCQPTQHCSIQWVPQSWIPTQTEEYYLSLYLPQSSLTHSLGWSIPSHLPSLSSTHFTIALCCHVVATSTVLLVGDWELEYLPKIRLGCHDCLSVHTGHFHYVAGVR